MQLFDLHGGASARQYGRFYDLLPSLAELPEQKEARAVLLKPEDRIEALAPFLDRLELVVVQFPGFRDGRGFTQARALREYLGFEGEIRAEGHILPDQALFLKRCGVDTVVLPKTHNNPQDWDHQLNRFSHYYQPDFLPEGQTS